MPLIKRSQWRAFMNTGTSASPVFNLMGEGFTQLDESKNPVEYSRKYIHEDSERTDVVGYAPSLDYSVDTHSGEPAIEKIVDVHENEYTGNDAQVEIVSVNMFEAGASSGSYVAYKRTYAIIPGSKNGDNALVYSGTFKACGDKVKGEFNPSTGVFTPASGTLASLAIEVIAGTSSTKTKVSDVVGEGSNSLKYKVGTTLTKPNYNDADTGYSALTLNTDIDCTANSKIIVVAVSGGHIVGASPITKVVVGS